MSRGSVPRNGSWSVLLEKTALFLGLGILVSVPYFLIQFHPLFPAKIVPATALDRMIPLVQPAAWIYLTLYFLLALPLFLSKNLNQIRTMAFGFAWVTVVSHVIFFLWPTAIPAFHFLQEIRDPALRLILSADTARNAMPSLHASLAVYCALCSALLLRGDGNKARIAIWGWTFLILAATLLTKRHVVLDLLTGAGLGAFAYAALFRTYTADVSESAALKETLWARAKMTHGIETEIAKLARQNGHKRLLEVACFAGIGMLGVFLTVRGLPRTQWLLLLPGIIVTSLALNAFVLLMHDGMHDTLLRTPLSNRAASVVIGSSFLMSFSAYRVLHTRHHKYLGDPRDPDDYKNYTGHRSLVWTLHFLRLAVGSLLYLFFIPALALKFGSRIERQRILVEYVLLVTIYGLLLRFVPFTILATAWLIPLLIVGTMTGIRGFTQHGITDATDPYIASRTILPNPIVGFFLLHENLHLEHHLFPEIPSYNLPRLHRLIWPKLPRAVSGRSYLGFLVRFFKATSRLDESPIGLERPAAKSS
jgi:fatty acid desaturase/membrane-associated phospholipid phosphatase